MRRMEVIVQCQRGNKSTLLCVSYVLDHGVDGLGDVMTPQWNKHTLLSHRRLVLINSLTMTICAWIELADLPAPQVLGWHARTLQRCNCGVSAYAEPHSHLA